MLRHWYMICTVVSPGEFDIKSIPLICTNSDSYHQALASFNKTLPASHKDNVEFHAFCDTDDENFYHLCYESSFCEAVKVDISKMNEPHPMSRVKETKYKDTVANTLVLVRVVFEDFGVAVNIHGKAKDTDNTHLISYLILLNDAFVFDKGLIEDEYYNPLQKECLKSFESFCVFDYHKYYNTFVVHLVGIL